MEKRTLDQARELVNNSFPTIFSKEDVINLLKKVLIPSSTSTPDAKVFYMKMQGDYYRYLCEFNSGEK